MSARRVRVASIGDLPVGQGRTVDADGRKVALFNVDGTLYAVDDRCAHRGGPLGAGELDGREVTCPWHGWRWDIETGASMTNPALAVACFPVSVDGDGVFIELS